MDPWKQRTSQWDEESIHSLGLQCEKLPGANHLPRAGPNDVMAQEQPEQENIHPGTPTVALLEHATKAKVVYFLLADCPRELLSAGFSIVATWPSRPLYYS